MLPLLALLLTPAVADNAPCPLGAGWATQPSSTGIRNILSMDRGGLTWNHVPISNEILRQYLRNAARISPRPEMVIDTTGMACAEQQRLAGEIEAAAACTPDICRAYDVVRGPLPPAPALDVRRR
ncbi:MAG: hypothetical protein MT490_11425 [Sphingomonas sp.]|uniref:hypothetical protein n=1 Tax=Sphingomonas sp. TaxID=28214 RepID=UPI00227510A8|nr:hypothetical protein [Sphingomonas sp.]MCX8476395.1 hypothetical protein [Sphingomonas sp.]